MGNDNDRLQQMEDNWNSGDAIFQALGVQLDTVRDIAKKIDQDLYDEALEYYLDEGYPQEMAEEYASQQINIDDEEAR